MSPVDNRFILVPRTLFEYVGAIPKIENLRKAGMGRIVALAVSASVAAVILGPGLAQAGGEKDYNRYCTSQIGGCASQLVVPKGGWKANITAYCGTKESHTPAKSIKCNSPNLWTDCGVYNIKYQCTCNVEESTGSYTVKIQTTCE